jgi:ankyrin repeat protein
MAGADINAKDIDGNTPCHFCAEYGHKDCLRYLLHKHPSLFSKNKEGLSPLDTAVSTEILQVSLKIKQDDLLLLSCRSFKSTSLQLKTLCTLATGKQLELIKFHLLRKAKP